MTPQEQRKADAQMLLEDQSVVVDRIVKVINELFNSDKNAKANSRWLTHQLIEGESLRKTRYAGTGHTDSQPLAAYIKQVIQYEAHEIMRQAAEEHIKQIDSRIRELHKLEKKGWFRP